MPTQESETIFLKAKSSFMLNSERKFSQVEVFLWALEIFESFILKRVSISICYRDNEGV